ncbi:secreted protein [Beggiatoa sp. PS]|nr:secreted protein [Beggiatoa sp. PS]
MRIFVDKTKIMVAIVSSMVLFLISGGSYGDDIEFKTLETGYKQELVLELKPNIPLVFTPPNKGNYLFKLNETELSNKTKKAVELDLSVDNFSYMNVSKDLDYIRNKYTSDREKIYALWNYIKEVVYMANPQPGEFSQNDPQLFLFHKVLICVVV